VETGRRDGDVSVAEYAENDLAPPDSNIVDVKTFFSVKSLNAKDIAVLFGTYTTTPSPFPLLLLALDDGDSLSERR
jgi:hypothetical protein